MNPPFTDCLGRPESILLVIWTVNIQNPKPQYIQGPQQFPILWLGAPYFIILQGTANTPVLIMNKGPYITYLAQGWLQGLIHFVRRLLPRWTPTGRACKGKEDLGVNSGFFGVQGFRQRGFWGLIKVFLVCRGSGV